MPSRRSSPARAFGRRRGGDAAAAPGATPSAADGPLEDALAGYHELGPADAVRLAYRVILEREPDPDGLAHHVALLEAGTMSRQGRPSPALARFLSAVPTNGRRSDHRLDPPAEARPERLPEVVG